MPFDPAANRACNTLKDEELRALMKAHLPEHWCEDHAWMDEQTHVFAQRFEVFLMAVAERTERMNKLQFKKMLKEMFEVPIDYCDFFASKLALSFMSLRSLCSKENYTGERAGAASHVLSVCAFSAARVV